MAMHKSPVPIDFLVQACHPHVKLRKRIAGSYLCAIVLDLDDACQLVIRILAYQLNTR